mmetsp:Transcript_21173/g.71691  ORF Transcript_21173/g.71691 Transcript_21173/m.71691 type:complete len:344 (+) Transcript_21173:2159-3190(+)
MDRALPPLPGPAAGGMPPELALREFVQPPTRLSAHPQRPKRREKTRGGELYGEAPERAGRVWRGWRSLSLLALKLDWGVGGGPFLPLPRGVQARRAVEFEGGGGVVAHAVVGVEHRREDGRTESDSLVRVHGVVGGDLREREARDAPEHAADDGHAARAADEQNAGQRPPRRLPPRAGAGVVREVDARGLTDPSRLALQPLQQRPPERLECPARQRLLEVDAGARARPRARGVGFGEALAFRGDFFLCRERFLAPLRLQQKPQPCGLRLHRDAVPREEGVAKVLSDGSIKVVAPEFRIAPQRDQIRAARLEEDDRGVERAAAEVEDQNAALCAIIACTNGAVT